jgi:hypothetical protein
VRGRTDGGIVDGGRRGAKKFASHVRGDCWCCDRSWVVMVLE